ncbi:hypothetical protein BCD96_001750 [Clostridium beijerinckii]|uniref:Uncharacterized protein n=1 Tax=Clostridium beijerinckii TaxID=1520 RepID=A0A1S8RYZ1_CLOBE|nr:hypothetical protein [Clostridium beijerinckii]NOW03456.1 hypothetical protein [Clostridium beijerinckii]NRT34360.1 hypothetical protein [Clostridium beijerinckii]NRT46209.1 hypothetical protein [Clostridium beijerinckii]NRT88297.1 hypothetical protein [Clostridium beijerinckii]
MTLTIKIKLGKIKKTEDDENKIITDFSHKEV